LDDRAHGGYVILLNVPNGQRIARFIEPMLLLRTDKLPEGDGWRYEVKFDGYRALAIKTGGTVRLRSRNDKDFTKRYPGVVAAFSAMPDETVIDGEVVALDAAGKPAFQLLQNGGTNVHFYAFDVLMLYGKDVTGEPLVKRRELLENHLLPGIPEPVRCSPVLEASLSDLVQSIRAQGLEGLVAKRANSRYEPGERSGAWMKMRVNLSQEFIIGGYSVGGTTFDAVILGHVVDGKLAYVARTRSGFTPALRAELLRKMKPLEVSECPFCNLPESKLGRWGEGLTANKMKDCRWLRTELTGRVEFLEWTEDRHLRHSRFVGLGR
jgi:bifunctional non-homologous end joining protein LigD